MMNLGKYVKTGMLIFAVYIYIFNPPVKGLPNLIWLLLPIVWGYLLYYSLVGKLLYLFKNEIILVILITLFTLLRDIDWTNGTSSKNFLYINGTLLIEAIPFAFFIVDICSRRLKLPDKASHEERLINIILWTCFFAALITVMLLVNPSLNNVMNNKILAASEYQQNNLLRGFGFASTLFYSYGLVQGTAAAIILLKMSEGRKHFVIYFITLVLLLISIMVNARIGMVPVIVMGFYLIFVRKKIKMFLYASGILGVMLVVFLSSDFAEKYQKIIEWGFGFFTQTLGFVSGGKSKTGPDTFGVLGNMVVLPDNALDWIVGSGADLFLHGQTSGTVTHSDIGFIRQLYYGGIVYLTLLMTLVTIMAVRLYNLKKHRWFFVLFVFTVIAANVKSNFINNHSAFRLFLLIYMGFIYYSFLERTEKQPRAIKY
ncbi:hypothetical protein [Mucilaginibacter sp. BT774]|uniref:hypothetical protein n=1 Tax=Mucilaginibacter sp. BT774 TaxID=3062276 RepID=UPI002675E64F|nr:hypothetical protein [Mucilaginibacter sp. BT774]MDO3625931.1 hypothetical protein [Mucilaginibacter sp. BT774]